MTKEHYCAYTIRSNQLISIRAWSLKSCLAYEFVEFIPDDPKERTLYISIAYCAGSAQMLLWVRGQS